MSAAQKNEKDLLWGDLSEKYGEGCFICGDLRDHDGLPHGTVTGDGRTRADIPPVSTTAPKADPGDEAVSHEPSGRAVTYALDDAQGVEPIFSFCEPSNATIRSYEHIRIVGDEGFLFGGGIQTPALCGADLRGGWDLQTPMNPRRINTTADLNPTCARCADLYTELTR